MEIELLTLGARWRYIVNFMPQLLYAWGKSSRYPFSRMLEGACSGLGTLNYCKILLPLLGIKLHLLSYLSCNWFVILTELSWIPYWTTMRAQLLWQWGRELGHVQCWISEVSLCFTAFHICTFKYVNFVSLAS